MARRQTMCVCVYLYKTYGTTMAFLSLLENLDSLTISLRPPNYTHSIITLENGTQRFRCTCCRMAQTDPLRPHHILIHISASLWSSSRSTLHFIKPDIYLSRTTHILK